MYVRFPLLLRNVEDLLFEHGIDICHETIRHWWNRFGPMFAADVRWLRISRLRGLRHWRWHLDEMYDKLSGEMVYLWRAVDQEGKILESYVTRSRDRAAALAFIKKTLRRHGSPAAITTDGLRSYRAAMTELGNADKQEIGRYANNRAENSHLLFRDESGRFCGSGRCGHCTSSRPFTLRFTTAFPGKPPHRPHHIQGTPLRCPGGVADARRLKVQGFRISAPSGDWFAED